MGKIIRLTESELKNLIKRILKENTQQQNTGVVGKQKFVPDDEKLRNFCKKCDKTTSSINEYTANQIARELTAFNVDEEKILQTIKNYSTLPKFCEMYKGVNQQLTMYKKTDFCGAIINSFNSMEKLKLLQHLYTLK